MSNLVLVVVGLLVVINAIALFVFAKRFGGKKDGSDGEGMKLLLTQLNEFSRTVDQKMAETNKMMNESGGFLGVPFTVITSDDGSKETVVGFDRNRINNLLNL